MMKFKLFSRGFLKANSHNRAFALSCIRPFAPSCFSLPSLAERGRGRGLLGVGLLLAFMLLLPNVAFADTAAQLRTQITNFNHGGSGTLTVGGTGNTVTVTGTVTGATNFLGLNINSDVTVNWQANYSGSQSSGLVQVAGTGTFNVNAEGAKIQNTGTGYALGSSGAKLTMTVSNGTVTTGTGIALRNAGGTISITGGTVSATGDGGSAVYNSTTGTITINGGTVSTISAAGVINNAGGTINIRGLSIVSATSGDAVSNSSVGTVNITDGEISSATGVAVRNQAGGTINISGSKTTNVQATGNSGRAIVNMGTGAVNISGGNVKSENAIAVDNGSTGKITISGGTVTSAITDISFATVFSFNNGTNTATRIEITGGTVRNTGSGNAIRNNSTGGVLISGGTVEANTGAAIRNSYSGNVTISGNNTVVKATGANGSGIFNSGNGTINISNGTVSSASHIAVDIGSEGKLTISGGTVTSAITNTAFATVYAHSNSNAATARIEITGGKVSNTGAGGYAVKNISADEVIIRGGTVEATETNGVAAVNHANGTLTIRGDYTIVQATANNGIAVLNFGNGAVNISAGTVSATSGDAVRNNAAGTVNISGGTVTTSTNGSAVKNSGAGTVNISAGTVSATSDGRGVRNEANGTINISGGTVYSNTFVAVVNVQTGKITVSGTATITAGITGESYGAIFAYDYGTDATTRIEITGGTVSNTASGNAIRNNSTGAVEISGGKILAKDGYAINKAGSGTLTINNNAIVFAYGTIDTHIINGTYARAGNAIITAWNKAAGITSYNLGTSNDIYKLPESATAIWANQGANNGISVSNGANTGFIHIEGIIFNDDDNSPPVPGNGINGRASINFADLFWDAAIDNQTSQANLRYYVYESSNNNITTVAECETNGTLLNTGGTLNLTEYKALGLSPATTYYFNVVVEDLAGNKAAYTAKEITTIVPFNFCDGDGTIGSPYQICTAQELKAFTDWINAGNGYATHNVYIKLMNDIDLSDYQAGEGWIPIGRYVDNTNNEPFKGNFDGNKHKITGLKINTTTIIYVGLFGYVEGGTIKNLGIENAEIICNHTNIWAGGIASLISNSTVSNCYITGEMNITASNIPVAGGIVGDMINSTISNCYSTMDVSTVSADNVFSIAGGIAGMMSGTLSNCYSTGAISSICASGPSAGGIAGLLSNSGSSISECAALNSGINCAGISSSFGRVVGYKSTVSNLSSNIAFADMLNPEGNTTWHNTGIYNIDGEDFDKAQINTDGTLGNRFISADGWTTKNGKLPGLFGNTVDMPTHLGGSDIDPSIFGTYTGTLNAQNPLLGINDTFSDMPINLINTYYDYILRIEEIEVGTGIILPAYEIENVTITHNTGGYLLSAPEKNIVVNEIIIPPTPPFFPSGAIFNNVPVKIELISAEIEDRVLKLSIDLTLTLGSLPYKFTIEYNGTILVGIKPITNDELRIKVYPNPTSGQLRITGIRHCGLDPQSPANNDEIAGQARNDIQGVQMFDITGRNVFTSSLSLLSPETILDISELPSGVYFLKVGNETVKVVKK